ncbi:MAG: hypothetical protein OEY22_07970 [Candidatus Bathyarchaeota archaeon]|nr:hypothetical protein [Candidatus Bathyarchaeota archaeon]MDH5787555.1 hypothetical protein [Candidatus Bathyarchaeota archaeon]
MSLKSKLKIENIGTFTTLAFYVVVGIICFAILPFANFPPHVGIIGILNLITAYGLFKKRIWAIWLVTVLLFVITTFSTVMLYYRFGSDLILSISLVVYLILTWIFTVYTIAKRKTLES